MNPPEPVNDNHDTSYPCPDTRQQHVFRWWHDLTPSRQEQLRRQLDEIDPVLLERLYSQATSGESDDVPAPEAIRPAKIVSLDDSPRAEEASDQAAGLGQQALEKGQVAVVLVAGGQGTRLGHDGPKGTFPIGPVSRKSLFQIHAEKVLAAGRRYGKPLPLYVMTSPENDEATQRHFADHDYFGLDYKRVFFFQQGMMPALDAKTGMFLMADKHRIATNPNGHGGVLKALADNRYLSDMHRHGIKYIFYYQVDNPLVKVVDPAYLGYHLAAEAEMSLKIVRKRHPEEKLGVVVDVEGSLRLIEYSDLDKEVARLELPDGSLEISAGNIAVHVFNLSFLERLAGDGMKLPYHRTIKRVPYLDENGQLVEPAEPNAIKFEMFIFDVLSMADRTLVMETDRKEEFEPLKNSSGENSPASVRQAMSNLFAGWLERAGVKVPCRPDGSAAVPLEISPLLALDAEELRQRLSWPGPVSGATLLDEAAESARPEPESLQPYPDRETGSPAEQAV